MLHIATVHYKTPQWIEIQMKHLREHISVPYQTWTSLQDIDPRYAEHFDHVLEQGRSALHGEKLNHLALEIAHEASDEDLLMFLDGDAFPIADPMPVIADALGKAALIAVRRAENVNEPQPHPCFCVTTVGTWRGLPGDWSRGHTWPEVGGKRASDVGANLLRVLELTGTPWVELLRSNGTTINPLLFAIYGDLVYHHGGGFRKDSVLSRADRDAWVAMTLSARPLLRGAPGFKRIGRKRQRDWERRREERNREQSQLMYEKIAGGARNWLAEVRAQ